MRRGPRYLGRRGAFLAFFTAPVSAHLVGRSAYRHRGIRHDLLIADELSDALERSRRDPTSEQSDQPPSAQ